MVLPGRAPGLHLSERGRVQADRVSEGLTGLPIDAVYSSPLERTSRAAAPRFQQGRAAQPTGFPLS
jgi:probable phosphoglycerate mutase